MPADSNVPKITEMVMMIVRRVFDMIVRRIFFAGVKVIRIDESGMSPEMLSDHQVATAKLA